MSIHYELLITGLWEVEEPRRAKYSDAINILPPSATVDSVMLDVGEHSDVIVEMNHPSEITTCKRSWIRADGAACAIVRSASAPGSSRPTIPAN